MPNDKKWLWLGLGAAGILAVGYYLFGQSTNDSDRKSAPKSATLDSILEPTTPTTPVSEARADVEQAKVAMAAQDWQTAAQYWSNAIKNSSQENYRYYTNRASCWLNLHRYVEAEADSRASLVRSNQPNYNAQINLAKALNGQGRHEEALKCLEQAAPKEPKQVQQAQALKKKIESAAKLANKQTAAQQPAKITINLDSKPATVNSNITITQSLDQASDVIAPPPAFRRQDTEEDLVNLDAEPASPMPNPASNQSGQTIEDHDHVFPVNQPPISFAEIVKHEPVEHADNPAESTASKQSTHANIPASDQLITQSPVPVPVLPHGSFASVVAHSVEHSADQSAEQSNNPSADQSRKQSTSETPSQSMSDSLNLVAQHEADEAMRHRTLAHAETTFYQSQPQPVAQSTESLKVPANDLHDDLTSSGVLVNESDVFDQNTEQPSKSVVQARNDVAVSKDVASESSNEANNQSNNSASKPVQTVLPLAGSWNKPATIASAAPSTNQPTSESSGTSPSSTQSSTQSSSPSLKSSTAPTTPKRKQQKKKQPQSGKKQSNTQSSTQPINQSTIPSNTESPLVSPKGPTPVDVPAPASGKSWASLIKK